MQKIEVLKVAEETNELMRNSGIKEETKGYLVSAIVLVLFTGANKLNKEFLLKKMQENNIEIGEVIYNELKEALDEQIRSISFTSSEIIKFSKDHSEEEIKKMESILIENKKTKEVIMNSFSFLKTLNALNNIIVDQEKSSINIVIALIEKIRKDIMIGITANKSKEDFDLLGLFYQEFTKYNSGDGNGLGIVLTPTHVCDLMAELIELKLEDTVLDLCTGSTSLLMACLRKIKPLDTENTFDISRNLIGIEFSDQLFAMAMINLLIREKTSQSIKVPRLISGSCFDKDFTGEDEKPQPTKLIINPPYSQCKNKEQKDLHELNFLNHGLNNLEKNGLGVAIFPSSCFTKNDKIALEYKRELLKNNRLKSVITMPDQLFYPVGTCTVISLWEAGIPHKDTDEVMFYDFKDDGFEIDRKESRKTKDKKESDRLLQEVVKSIKNNKIVSGKSVLSTIKDDDEWVYESFRPTEKPTENDFLQDIKEKIMYDIQNEMEK